jgi:glutathione synthase/RimK-type ligase-like ATP-grasp enzyme
MWFKICAIVTNNEPWIYYNKYKFFLEELQHPFKENIDFFHINELSDDFIELNDYKAIAFYHFDPLEVLYPIEFKLAENIQKYCIENSKYMINTPQSLSNSIKSIQLSILSKNGFNVAESFRFNSTEDLEKIDESYYPLFLRYDAGHDSNSKAVYGPYKSFSEITENFKEEKLVNSTHFSGKVAIQFIPTITDEKTYKKYRVFATREYAITGNLQVSYKWYVHRPDSITNKKIKREFDDFVNSSLSEDKVEYFRTIIKVLKLEFGAIDFSYMKDGTIIIWEVNPNPAFPKWTEDSEFKKRITDLISNQYKSILNIN